jgi:hypothetical protein
MTQRALLAGAFVRRNQKSAVGKQRARRVSAAKALPDLLMGEDPMKIVRVFDWFARDSAYAAEHTDEPRQRDIWIKFGGAVEGRGASRGDETGTTKSSPSEPWRDIHETYGRRPLARPSFFGYLIGR